MSVSFTSFGTVPGLTAGSGVVRPQSVNIDSGFSTGNIFDGRGNDFLDPDNLAGSVTSFSGSIRPVRSNTLTARLVGSNFFGKHPDAADILSGTNGLLNRINSPSFGAGLIITPPVVADGSGNLIPNLGANPDPTKITLFTNFFSQNVNPFNSVFDPRNFNPLQWQNPSAANILLGSMNASATVLNGGNIFPPFNPFPSQGAINFPFNPFGGGMIGGTPAIPAVAFPVPVPVPVVPVAPGVPVRQTPPSNPLYQMLSLMNDITGSMSQLLRQWLPATGNSGNSGTAGSTYYPPGYPNQL